MAICKGQPVFKPLCHARACHQVRKVEEQIAQEAARLALRDCTFASHTSGQAMLAVRINTRCLGLRLTGSLKSLASSSMKSCLRRLQHEPTSCRPDVITLRIGGIPVKETDMDCERLLLELVYDFLQVQERRSSKVSSRINGEDGFAIQPHSTVYTHMSTSYPLIAITYRTCCNLVAARSFKTCSLYPDSLGL